MSDQTPRQLFTQSIELDLLQKVVGEGVGQQFAGLDLGKAPAPQIENLVIGQLDDDQIFYLRSRGLPEVQARELLTYAFANNLLEKVKLDALREELAGRLVRHEEVS